jgi:regulator of telomere elongation helicase 1
VQQAVRAVNQAMGRVIRHRYDYGAILLADERFCSPANQRQLSKWLKQYLQVYDGFGQAIASLTKFFKVRQESLG